MLKVENRPAMAEEVVAACQNENDRYEKVVRILSYRFHSIDNGRSETVSAVVEMPNGVNRFCTCHRSWQRWPWESEEIDVEPMTTFIYDAVDGFTVAVQGETVEGDHYIWRDAVWHYARDNWWAEYVHGGQGLLGEVPCRECGTLIDVDEGQYDADLGWLCWACQWMDEEGEYYSE